MAHKTHNIRKSDTDMMSCPARVWLRIVKSSKRVLWPWWKKHF